MASRPQFEMIVAAAPRKKMVSYDLTIPATIAAGQSKALNIYAGSGRVCKVVSMHLYADPTTGATSGDHTIRLNYTGPTIDLALARSPFGQMIIFSNSGFWAVTGAINAPSDNASQLAMMQGIIFDDATPLTVTYINNTNGTQNTNVTVRVRAIEELIV